ncbi:hypothetical protein J6590_058444 [Homalodisca vitripennis]|nr:hypothetical protein J6590_058444 [Homalodisca vitripennis]
MSWDFAKVTGSLEAKQVYSADRKMYQCETRQAKLKTNAAFIEGAVNKCSAAWKTSGPGSASPRREGSDSSPPPPLPAPPLLAHYKLQPERRMTVIPTR